MRDTGKRDAKRLRADTGCELMGYEGVKSRCGIRVSEIRRDEEQIRDAGNRDTKRIGWYKKLKQTRNTKS